MWPQLKSYLYLDKDLQNLDRMVTECTENFVITP